MLVYPTFYWAENGSLIFIPAYHWFIIKNGKVFIGGLN